MRLFAQLDLHTESNFFTGYSDDLSDGGVFVATYEPLEVGQRVELELCLPGGRFLVVHGRVAWLREPAHTDADLSPGVGVSLRALDDTARTLIAQFMARREPNFVDPDDLNPGESMRPGRASVPMPPVILSDSSGALEDSLRSTRPASESGESESGREDDVVDDAIERVG